MFGRIKMSTFSKVSCVRCLSRSRNVHQCSFCSNWSNLEHLDQTFAASVTRFGDPFPFWATFSSDQIWAIFEESVTHIGGQFDLLT